MGIQQFKTHKKKSIERTVTRSKNLYLNLLIKIYRFLARKTKSNFNNVILTDGYTDHLNFKGIKGKTLIISVGTKCPIADVGHGRIKQIVLEANEK